MGKKHSSGLDHVLSTPIGVVYGISSLATFIGLPILGVMNGRSPEECVGLAIGGLIAAGVLTTVVGMAVYIFVRLGPLLAAIQIALAVKAILAGGNPHVHLDLWCQIVSVLGIYHDPMIEYICAAVTIFGWMSPKPR